MTAGCRWAVVALVAVAAPARAQAPAAGDEFKKGRELVKAGKFAEACPHFDTSQELDPQLGTLFNIAQCDEKIGKLATAMAAYREVIAKDTNAKRRASAEEMAGQLAPRVPKLVVRIAHPPASLVVTLDGPTGAKPITLDQPVEVDFGDYTVVARADGFREFQSKTKLASEGQTATVTVRLEPVHVDDKPIATAPPPPVDVAPARSHRKTYAAVTLVVGGAAVATSVVFGALAHSKWNDAQAVCGGTTCPTQGQVDQANALADTARGDGNVATGLAIGGGVAIVVGAALWLTAPSSEHAVHVTATARSVGVAGRF